MGDCRLKAKRLGGPKRLNWVLAARLAGNAAGSDGLCRRPPRPSCRVPGPPHAQLGRSRPPGNYSTNYGDVCRQCRRVPWRRQYSSLWALLRAGGRVLGTPFRRYGYDQFFLTMSDELSPGKGAITSDGLLKVAAAGQRSANDTHKDLQQVLGSGKRDTLSSAAHSS